MLCLIEPVLLTRNDVDLSERVAVHVAVTRNSRKEGNVLFNDALNTFYKGLYGVTHMVKEGRKCFI